MSTTPAQWEAAYQCLEALETLQDHPILKDFANEMALHTVRKAVRNIRSQGDMTFLMDKPYLDNHHEQENCPAPAPRLLGTG